MPDLADLLDRTTPRGLAPPDLAAIAHTARRRRRTRRAAPLVAAVVVLAVTAGILAVGTDDGPEEVASAANPWGGTELLTAPVGEWRRAADPPFSPRTPELTGVLSDGRVLSWGGEQFADDQETVFIDGGIYDPTTDTWEPIGPAPLPGDDLEVRNVALAQDRLLVLGITRTGPTGRFVGAVYDVASRRWSALPDGLGIEVLAEGVAWTGDVLAVTRFNHGAVGWAPDDTLDWRIDAPVTRRWRFGEDAWTDGAAPPLDLRSNVAVAFDGNRLAIVGGTETAVFQRELPPGPTTGPDPGLQRAGAVYDVAADTWAAVPPLPVDRVINPYAAWLDDGRLVVSGGSDRFNMDTADMWREVADVYDPATGAWSQLPPSPEPPDSAPQPVWRPDSYVVGAPVLLGAYRPSDSSGPHPGLLYLPTGWEETPLKDLRVVGPAIVATSASNNNPDDERFEVYLRSSAGIWLRAAEAPFMNRMQPGVATIGDDSLLIVGGGEGRHLEDRGDAWILDLNP